MEVDPIIKNYLKDTSIPLEKRTFVLGELKKGAAQNKLSEAISNKYGDKYGSLGFPLDSVTSQAPVAERKGWLGRAASATKEAFTGGVGRTQEGFIEIKGARDREEMAARVEAMQRKKLAAGEIDQAKFDELKAATSALEERSDKEENRGLAKVVRGGTEIATAPIAGAAESTIAPLAEKAIGSLGEEGQQKFAGAVEKVGQLGERFPIARDLGMAVANVAVGGKGTQVAGKAALKGAKAAVPVVEAAGELATAGAEGIGKAFAKRSAKKGVAVAEEILRPLPTQKNLQAAAAKGRATLGKKGLIYNKGDKIELSPKMKTVAQTLQEAIPNIKKVKPESLPVVIDDKIGQIARPLRESFKEMPISQESKKTITSSWDKLKRKQALDPDFELGVEKMQKNFEDGYLSKITNRFKDPSGKFRQPTANDIWEIAKAYDNSISPKVKGAIDEVAEARILAQQEAWLQNRRILRKLMEDLAKSSKEASVKDAFMTMSRLYEAKSQILKNIKPTKKGLSVFVKGAAAVGVPTGLITTGASLMDS
jgi:hypothetical protein